MENNEEYLETISLCDLQMNEGNECSENISSPQDFFEFFTESDSENYTFSDIIFCGKNISNENYVDERQEAEEQLNENLSPLFRSNSFCRPIIRPMNQNRVNSARFYSSQNLQRVNTITGLTSMSAKCRRRMFMFGPVKFKPEMELSAIKQRQGRRCCASRATGFPVGGEMTTLVVPESKGGGTTALVKSSQTKKIKSGFTRKLTELWCRPHFVNVLSKSLSCFSMRKHCMALP